MDLGLDKFQDVFEKLARLPSHYRLALVAVVPLLIGLGYWQLLYAPASAELTNLEGQQRNLQRKLNEVRSVAANLDAFQGELEKLQKELTVAVRQLPNSKELPGLLTDITTLGKNAGLEFKYFRPKTEVDRGFYAEVPIAIEFTGGFHETAMFFDRVAKLPRIVNISDIQMSISQEQMNGTLLKVTGKATTFRFLGRGGDA